MTKLKLLFRFFLLVSLACWISQFGLDYWPQAMRAEWMETMTHRGDGALPWHELLMAKFHFEPTPELRLLALGALYALSGMGYIGMFVFSRLGRGLFLFVLWVHFCLVAVSGLTVYSPLEQLLLNLGLVLDGVLLSMAYASSLAALFEHQEPAVEKAESFQPVSLDTEKEIPAQAPEKLSPMDHSSVSEVVPPLPQI